VIGTPHEILDLTPYAFLILKSRDAESEDRVIGELKELAKSRIVEYGLPTHYLVGWLSGTTFSN
jgi:hypothetical protein